MFQWENAGKKGKGVYLNVGTECVFASGLLTETVQGSRGENCQGDNEEELMNREGIFLRGAQEMKERGTGNGSMDGGLMDVRLKAKLMD